MKGKEFRRPWKGINRSWKNPQLPWIYSTGNPSFKGSITKAVDKRKSIGESNQGLFGFEMETRIPHYFTSKLRLGKFTIPLAKFRCKTKS